MIDRFIFLLSLALSILSLFVATHYKTERVQIFCKYHNSIYLENKPVATLVEEDNLQENDDITPYNEK